MMWILLTFLVVLIYCLLTWFSSRLNYWKVRGVPHMKPIFFLGNLHPVFLNGLAYEDVIGIAYRYHRNDPYFGFYNLTHPTLYLKDPRLIEAVLMSDFDHFSSRGLFYDGQRDPLSTNLVYVDRDLWKYLRAKLCTCFTPSKLRSYLPLTEKCIDDFYLNLDSGPFEAKRLFNRLILDVMVKVLLNVQLPSETNDELLFHSESTFRLEGLQGLKVLINLFVPGLASFLGLKMVSRKGEKFFIHFTEKLLAMEDKICSDFVKALKSIQKEGKDHPEFKVNLGMLAAQVFMICFAGLETTSTAFSYSLYHLSKDPNIFEKARSEINKVTRDGIFDHAHLKQMKYIRSIINETLRLYPPTSGILRKCTKEYMVDGLKVEEGVSVVVPIGPIHRDPQYFSEPELFIPERFENEPHPWTFFPFGAGPRVCLGQGWSVELLTLLLAKTLDQFEIDLDGRTCEPLVCDPMSLTSSPKGGVWLRFRRRQ